jgi:hypothetical protein
MATKAQIAIAPEISAEDDDRYVTPEEGRRMFDEAARKIMGMSGDEFIRRWDAGEYAEVFDKEGYRHIGHLAGLISFARQNA